MIFFGPSKGGGGSGGSAAPQAVAPPPPPQQQPIMIGQPEEYTDDFNKLMDDLFNRFQAAQMGMGNIGFAPPRQQPNSGGAFMF